MIYQKTQWHVQPTQNWKLKILKNVFFFVVFFLFLFLLFFYIEQELSYLAKDKIHFF